MDKIEKALGELMPLEDIPGRTDMVAEAEEETLLTENQRQLLVELFDYLEVVHEHTARSCSILAALLKTLSTAQLKMVLQASVRPLVQLNALGGLFNPPLARPQRAELPDEVNERVWLTMMADPYTGPLAKEQMNSPTCLLAAAFSHKVLKKFGGGVRQSEIQEWFNVRPKQLATCITGRKYLDGTDQKALSRKYRASDNDNHPSTSK